MTTSLEITTIAYIGQANKLQSIGYFKKYNSNGITIINTTCSLNKLIKQIVVNINNIII